MFKTTECYFIFKVQHNYFSNTSRDSFEWDIVGEASPVTSNSTLGHLSFDFDSSVSVLNNTSSSIYKINDSTDHSLPSGLTQICGSKQRKIPIDFEWPEGKKHKVISWDSVVDVAKVEMGNEDSNTGKDSSCSTKVRFFK